MAPVARAAGALVFGAPACDILSADLIRRSGQLDLGYIGPDHTVDPERLSLLTRAWTQWIKRLVDLSRRNRLLETLGEWLRRPPHEGDGLTARDRELCSLLEQRLPDKGFSLRLGVD